MAERLDVLLVARGLFETRTQARAAILAGEITVDGRLADKPGTQVAEACALTVAARPRFVSRGGDKLDHAMEVLGISVEGEDACDLGSSTGGFVDRLLQGGASRVIAVDVGYGQLDYGLRGDQRVTVLERTNARYLTGDRLPFAPSFVTADLSFISLTVALGPVLESLRRGYRGLVLVKPQFEAGRERVGKGGVVRDAGVPTSDFCVYETVEDLEGLRFGAPFFVKPVAEGTGKGCSAKSIVRDRVALAGVCDDLVARFRQPALIEPYLAGREFTVGITGTGREAKVVGAMEIVLLANAEEGVYSFDNKSQYEDRVVYPATDPANDPVAAAAERVSLDAWRALGCRDGGRVDIRCDADQNPMFLEVNPLAGLNPKDSDLPILARMAGITYTQLIGRIMASAVSRLK